jgi:hypothetical protein
MIDFVKDDEFNFWLPMDIAKADPKAKKKDTRRIIQGIASTPDLDLQKEEVEQRGIDSSYFIKYGYYNNDHKPGFENKVGQPLECKITKDGLWTRGFLFKSHKIADSIWELANALEASQSDRKLGFSIQGKVTRRAGRRIMACWIQDIAITAAPINTNTWIDVVKSLNAIPSEYWCDDTGCFYVSPRQISPVHKSNCGTCQNTLNKNMNKVFSGLAIDESKMDLKKDSEECGCSCSKEKDDKEKAMQAGSPVAQVESLEGKMANLEWGGANKKYANKSLKFNDCVDILCEFRRLSRPDAVVVAEAVFESSGHTFTN